MRMHLLRIAMLAATAAAITAASAARAQGDQPTGIYGVVRGGIQIDTKAKYKDSDGSTLSAIDQTFKNKRGFSGEIGAGYDFGRFRLEQTIGYGSTKLDRDKAEDGGFLASGRSKAFTVALAGYVDFPIDEMIVPFIGGGAGISRVDARMERASTLGGIGSRYDDKDYGLRWHADAGVGIRVAPATTVEVSGRYSQTSMLKFKGESGPAASPVADEFKPRLSTISALVGVRHVF